MNRGPRPLMRHDRTVNRDTPKRAATSISVSVLLPEDCMNDCSNPTSPFASRGDMVTSASDQGLHLMLVGVPRTPPRWRHPGEDDRSIYEAAASDRSSYSA